MIFDPPLVPARLVSRYKRFLFDAVLPSGETITGFCPNTGSMRGLTAPGSPVWLSQHQSAQRKYRHALELVGVGDVLVGINTALPNALAEEGIRRGLVDNLHLYPTLRREQRYGKNSRIDMLLAGDGLPNAYVEVKNVHFTRESGLAEFPDTVTARGMKHLDELADMADAGHRAIMIYLVQREDCARFRLSGDLDPAYAAAFRRAVDRGVEAFALKCRVTTREIAPCGLIPIDEPGIAALRK